MTEGQATAASPAANARSTPAQRPVRQGRSALEAFALLMNGAANQPQPAPSRRQLDPDGFALDFVRQDRLQRQLPGGFALEPGRTRDELAQMALSGALFDKEALGRLYRARLAAMISAAELPQDFVYVARALRHTPDWAIESPAERDERLNAIAGISVEQSRRERRDAEAEEAARGGPQAVAAELASVATNRSPAASRSESQGVDRAVPQAAQGNPLNRAQRRRVAKLQQEQAKQRR